jgi:hypothetical protein
MGSGFSNGQMVVWLCCSLFALIAHLSPYLPLTFTSLTLLTFFSILTI